MAYLSDNERPDFEKMPDGLVPAVIQDAHTKQALMLGYMNAEAFDVTLSSGYVTFFSRSKKRLWMKGETTGNTLKVNQFLLDPFATQVTIHAGGRKISRRIFCHCWSKLFTNAKQMRPMDHTPLHSLRQGFQKWLKKSVRKQWRL